MIPEKQDDLVVNRPEKGKKEPRKGRRKDALAYPENPFWNKVEVKLGKKHITVSGGAHVNTATGETMAHSGVHVVREVDEAEFVKLYTGNIKSIFDLKPGSQRILQYLIVQLQKTPNADAIYLAWVGAEEYFSEHQVKMSRSAFYNALKELMVKGFIAESTLPNLFWFNPNLFFNGDRMTFINEIRRKASKEQVVSASQQPKIEVQKDWVEESTT